MNPILDIKKTKKPKRLFHSHILNKEILKKCIDNNTNIDIDVSTDKEGEAYIGHAEEYYKYKNIPQPKNISLDFVASYTENKPCFITLDCKDSLSMQTVENCINIFGSERIVVHAFTKALFFETEYTEKNYEPHWAKEYIDIEWLSEIRKKYNVPVIATHSPMYKKEFEKHLPEIISRSKGKIDSLGVNLIKYTPPTRKSIEKILSNDILPAIPTSRPWQLFWKFPHIGATNFIKLASSFNS